MERVAERSVEAPCDGHEKKTKTSQKNRREKILIPTSSRAFDRVESEKDPHHGDDGDRADDHGAHGNVAIDAAGRCGLTGAFGANVFESGAQSGNDGGHGAEKSDQAGGGDCACAHRTNVAAPEIVW